MRTFSRCWIMWSWKPHVSKSAFFAISSRIRFYNSLTCLISDIKITLFLNFLCSCLASRRIFWSWVLTSNSNKLSLVNSLMWTLFLRISFWRRTHSWLPLLLSFFQSFCIFYIQIWWAVWVVIWVFSEGSVVGTRCSRAFIIEGVTFLDKRTKMAFFWFRSLLRRTDSVLSSLETLATVKTLLSAWCS